MPFTNDTTFEVSNNIVFRKQGEDSFVLIEIEGENIFQLNEVSASVWEGIVAGSKYGILLESLEETYEDFGKNEIAEVDSFLNDLIEKDIIKAL